MARIRTIKPEYWDDEIVGSISLPARLLFPATWNFADDEGLVNWSAAYLKGAVFRYDQNVTVEHVAEWMREIEDAGFVYAYSTSRARNRIAFVVNFRDHQRIDKPQAAKLPVPNWRDPSVVMVYARRDDFVCGHCAEPVNEEFASDAGGRRYDPTCQRIKSATERPAGPDDPSNIQVVHVMCAKDFDPGTPLKPIPGTFREGSGNGPGSFQERSSVPVSPVSPLPQALDAPVTQGNEGPGETTGQSIPGTFQERSCMEGKGREGNRERKGSNFTAPSDALFDVEVPAASDSAADKPQPDEATAKSKAPGPKKADKPADSSRGTRIPADFAITDSMREWGRKNAPHVDGQFATDEFVDYWITLPGSKALKLDWVRTWQSRMRALEKRALERMPAAPRSAPTQAQGAQVIAFPGQRVSATRRAVDQAEAAGEEAKRMLAAMQANGTPAFTQIGSGA